MHTNLIQPKIIFTHDKTINLDNPKCAIFRKIRLFDLMMHSFYHLNNIDGRFFPSNVGDIQRNSLQFILD